MEAFAFLGHLSLGIYFGKYWLIIIFLNGKFMDKWFILAINNENCIIKEIHCHMHGKLKMLLVGHIGFEILFLIS